MGRDAATCQWRSAVQTKHPVLQPMRADFQEQVLECGQVKDKDSCQSTSAHKLHIASAHFTPHSFDSAQDLRTVVSRTNGSQSVKFKDKFRFRGHHTCTGNKQCIDLLAATVKTPIFLHKTLAFNYLKPVIFIGYYPRPPTGLYHG